MPAIQPAFVHPCVFVHLRANEYPLVRTDRGRVQCIDDIPATEKYIYIYIYITSAYSYLLPHPRHLCRASLSAKRTFSSFSRRCGLVANPEFEIRDPGEFPWSFTRCSDDRSAFILSFFFSRCYRHFHFFCLYLEICRNQSVFTRLWFDDLNTSVVGFRPIYPGNGIRSIVGNPYRRKIAGVFANHYI